VRRRFALLAAALAAPGASACVGYTDFSNHRTARLLAPGQHAVTAAVGGAHYELVGSPESAQGVALSAGYRRGATPRLEWGARVSHLRWNGTYDGSNTLVLGDVAWAALPDELALSLPVGIVFGDDDDDGVRYLQAQPGVVTTVTLSRTLELDGSVRLIVVSDNALTDFGVLSGAATIGVRWRSDWHRFELHPELGLMIDDLTGRFEGMPPDTIGLGDSLTLGVSLGVTWLP
jgi:hypothetical protein